MVRAMPDRLQRWWPLAACAAVLVWHSLRFDFVTDDAYVSFVYSRNLAEHGSLTFNLGDPVEGYTSFLWTFVLGLLDFAGWRPEHAARVLGTLFGIGTLVVAFRLTERLLVKPDEDRRTAWAYVPPALLACSSGFACWSSGGLETAMFTFLVLASIDTYVAARWSPRLLRRAGVLLALAAMTRPEGLLVVGVIGLHRLAGNLIGKRIKPTADELLCLLAFLALWAPWFAWRWSYYGHAFPNTYYVKATGKTSPGYDQALRDHAWRYLWQWATQVKVLWAAPLWLTALFGGPWRGARAAFVALAAPLIVLYLGYTVSVGGDFMGLHRFILPVFPLIAILVVLGLERLTGFAPPRWVAPAAAAIVVVAFGITQARLTDASLHPARGKLAPDKVDTPAFLIAYTENRAAIGRAMEPCFRDDDFSIVGGAGAQPYFGRMRAVDVYGLVSDKVAHQMAPTYARPGHNKWGSHAILASYEPTFVFVCYFIHSKAETPKGRFSQQGCDAWPAADWERVTVQVPGLDGKREERDEASAGKDAVADRYTFLVRKDRAFACPSLSVTRP